MSVPPGVRVSYVVFDRVAGRTVVQRGAREVFRAASVVKILLALDFLRGRVVVGRDRGLVEAMLRASDDDAASELWERGGRAWIVERMVRLIGLRETVPPPEEMSGFWGYTAISARDVVRAYRFVLGAPEGRFVVEQLREATARGTDGFDQTFGLPQVGAWAVKQGWSGFEDVPDRRAAPVELGLGRPALHTTGLVGDKIVAVLTLHPEGTPAGVAAGGVTSLAREILAV